MTYRTLKRQFQLDDAALEDLKLELIKGQRLAVDEDGDVLVWMGAAGTLQEPVARPVSARTATSHQRCPRPLCSQCRTPSAHRPVL